MRAGRQVTGLGALTIKHGADTDGEEGIAQSLLYCENHVIPDGRDTPLFEKFIVPSKLLQPWKTEYARQNPNLAWAKSINKPQVCC